MIVRIDDEIVCEVRLQTISGTLTYAVIEPGPSQRLEIYGKVTYAASEIGVLVRNAALRWLKKQKAELKDKKERKWSCGDDNNDEA